jgi:hypothetical protein
LFHRRPARHAGKARAGYFVIFIPMLPSGIYWSACAVTSASGYRRDRVIDRFFETKRPRLKNLSTTRQNPEADVRRNSGRRLDDSSAFSRRNKLFATYDATGGKASS